MNEWFKTSLDTLPAGHGPLLLVGTVGVGLLYCFFGYPLFRLILGLTGFLVAGTVAALLVAWLSGGYVVGMLIALGLGGLCGAMALFWLYRTGVFLVGVLGAALAAQNILGGRPEPWVPYAIFGVSVAGGLLALFLERPMMTLATAAIGASLAVWAMALLILATGIETPLSDPARSAYVPWILAGCWMALAFAGAIIQFYLRGARKK